MKKLLNAGRYDMKLVKVVMRRLNHLLFNNINKPKSKLLAVLVS